MPAPGACTIGETPDRTPRLTNTCARKRLTSRLERLSVGLLMTQWLVEFHDFLVFCLEVMVLSSAGALQLCFVWMVDAAFQMVTWVLR